MLCLTLHVAIATDGPTDEAETLAPKATSDKQAAKKAEPRAAKQVNLGGLLGGGKRTASKGKPGKTVKNKNPVMPRTTIPAGPTVDKRVDFVQPIGQSLAENGGSSSGGWPAEIPNKGKRRKGNRKG